MLQECMTYFFHCRTQSTLHTKHQTLSSGEIGSAGKVTANRVGPWACRLKGANVAWLCRSKRQSRYAKIWGNDALTRMRLDGGPVSGACCQMPFSGRRREKVGPMILLSSFPNACAIVSHFLRISHRISAHSYSNNE